DLPAKTFIKPIVVIDVQKTAAREVIAEPRDLGVTEFDVAVARDMEEWVVPQLVVHQGDAGFRLVHLKRGALANRRQKIREAGRIRVPIAAAVVLETRD